MQSNRFLRITILSSVIVILLFPKLGYSFNATLEWDANPESDNIDHYEVFSREENDSYDYNNPVAPNPATPTQYEFTGLTDSAKYYFVVRAVDDQDRVSSSSREVCVWGPDHSDLGPDYNRGWAVTEGSLEGFMVLYNDPDNPPLTLGPSSDIPPLNLSAVNGVGLPLNLLPSPTNNFVPPVKLLIPCPGYSNVSGLDIYHYDGLNWALADDTWMVPDSRVNNNNGNPSTIEIEVYHFSGAQAGAISNSSSGGGSGGGCFVAAAADDA